MASSSQGGAASSGAATPVPRPQLLPLTSPSRGGPPGIDSGGSVGVGGGGGGGGSVASSGGARTLRHCDESFSSYMRSGSLASPRPPAPPVRASLLSLDPQRRLAEDGLTPFAHRFVCLSAHGQSALKVLVGISAYNESWPEIRSTVHGVLDNLCTLQDVHEPRSARAAAGARLLPAGTRASLANLRPHEVAVVVIFDGREKMHASMFGDFAADGCVLPPSAREGMVARLAAAAAARGGGPRPASSPVRDLHLFEMLYDAEKSLGEPFGVKLNLLLAVKEKNGGKLNSHVWLFRALAPLLRPRYVVLLDAGTVPERAAVLHLYADMEANGSIGGCAGEICVQREQQSCFAPIIGVQLFEYSVANLLDKSMESVLGFIGVLPGAFSAYRLEALHGRPLDTYFMLEDRGAAELSPSMANAYLAEDRLLGFEIVAKEGCAWTLHYNHNAQAFTDVPDSVGKLIRQRRRWGNGSLFAQALALGEWPRLLSSTRHGLLRKAGFALLYIYYILSMILSLCVLGNAYFSYALLFQMLSDYFLSMQQSNAVFGSIFAALMYVYQFTLATLFVYSLGNRPDESETVWLFCVGVLGAFNSVAFGLLIYLLVKAVALSWQLWTGGATVFFAIFFCAAVQGRLGWVLSSTPAFFFLAPMLLLVIPIYSLCNVHDVSWGTREAHASAAAEADARRRDMRFREYRSMIVLAWVFFNLLLTQLLSLFSGGVTGSNDSSSATGGGGTNSLSVSADAQRRIILYYVCGVAGACAFLLAMRIIGSLVYAALDCAKRNGCAGTHVWRTPARPYTSPTTFSLVPIRAALTSGSRMASGYSADIVAAAADGSGRGMRGGSAPPPPPPPPPPPNDPAAPLAPVRDDEFESQAQYDARPDVIAYRAAEYSYGVFLQQEADREAERAAAMLRASEPGDDASSVSGATLVDGDSVVESFVDIDDGEEDDEFATRAAAKKDLLMAYAAGWAPSHAQRQDLAGVRTSSGRVNVPNIALSAAQRASDDERTAAAAAGGGGGGAGRQPPAATRTARSPFVDSPAAADPADVFAWQASPMKVQTSIAAAAVVSRGSAKVVSQQAARPRT